MSLSTEGHPDQNKPENALNSLLYITAILGVVLTIWGVIGGAKALYPMIFGSGLLALAIQVWIVLTAFRAWRHESRHQAAALDKRAG